MAKNYLSNKEIQILTGALEPESEGATGSTGSLYTNTTDGTVWVQTVGGDVTGWKELGATADNIYNADGTIPVDRIVEVGSNTIKFDGSLVLDEKPSIYIDANQLDIIFEKYLEGTQQRQGTLWGGTITQNQTWTLPNATGTIAVGPAWAVSLPSLSEDGNAIVWNNSNSQYELADVSAGATNGLRLDGSLISLGGTLGEETLINQSSTDPLIPNTDWTLTLKDTNFQYIDIFNISGGTSVVDIFRTDYYYASGKVSENSSVIRIGGSENITSSGTTKILYCAGATLSGYETHTSVADTSATTVLNGKQIVLNAYLPGNPYVSDFEINSQAAGIYNTAILTDESGFSEGKTSAISSILLQNGDQFLLQNLQIGQSSGRFLIRDKIQIGDYSNVGGVTEHTSLYHEFSMEDDLTADYTGILTNFNMDTAKTIGGDFYAHKITINESLFPTVSGTKYGISIEDSSLLNQFYGGIEYGTFSKIYNGPSDDNLYMYGKSSVFFVTGGGGPTDSYTAITQNEITCATTDYENKLNDNSWEITDLNSGFRQFINYAGSGTEPLTANREYEFPDESGVLALRGLYTQTLAGMTTPSSGSAGAATAHGITGTIVGYTIICDAVDGKLITPNDTAIADSDYSAWVTSTTTNYSGDFTTNNNVAGSSLKFLITHTI